MKRKRRGKHATYKITPQKALMLRDMAEAAEYGSLRADARVQVKMPSEVVKMLDILFPEVDRSRMLTKLALDAIVEKLRYMDNPDLAIWAEDEQNRMDELWDYLEERERGV